MANQQKRFQGLAGIVAIAAFSWSGCGVEDGGDWERAPGPNYSVPSVIDSTEIANPVQPTLSGESVLPTTPVSETMGFMTCKLPAAPALSFDAYDTPFYSSSTQVCLGEKQGSASQANCREVEAYEQRAKAITKCFLAAREELNRQGTKILGHDWVAASMPLLPEAWSMSTTEVESLVGRVSTGLVYLMTGGQAFEAEANPFCFYRPPHANAEEVKTQSLDAINAITKDTTARLNKIMSALGHGVDVRPDHDLRLQLTVKFIETSANIESGMACVYHTSF
jgi:hypothetical protein